MDDEIIEELAKAYYNAACAEMPHIYDNDWEWLKREWPAAANSTRLGVRAVWEIFKDTYNMQKEQLVRLDRQRVDETLLLQASLDATNREVRRLLNRASLVRRR